MASTCVEGAGTWIENQRVARKNWKRETSLLLVTAILPLTLLNGCAGVVSASKTQPVSQGSFQVTPASVSFGKVPVGKATLQSLSVSNTGNIAENTHRKGSFGYSTAIIPGSFYGSKSRTERLQGYIILPNH